MLLWSQFFLDAVRFTNGFGVRIPDAGTNRQYFVDLAKTNNITTLPRLRDLLRTIAEQTSVQLNLNPTVDNPSRAQPYVDTASLGIQRELSSTIAAGVDFIHSKSKETLVQVDQPAAAVHQLFRRGVIVTEKPEGIRVATHFFNNEDDIQRLIEALTQTRV